MDLSRSDKKLGGFHRGIEEDGGQGRISDKDCKASDGFEVYRRTWGTVQ